MTSLWFYTVPSVENSSLPSKQLVLQDLTKISPLNLVQTFNLLLLTNAVSSTLYVMQLAFVSWWLMICLYFCLHKTWAS